MIAKKIFVPLQQIKEKYYGTGINDSSYVLLRDWKLSMLLEKKQGEMVCKV